MASGITARWTIRALAVLVIGWAAAHLVGDAAEQAPGLDPSTLPPAQIQAPSGDLDDGR